MDFCEVNFLFLIYVADGSVIYVSDEFDIFNTSVGCLHHQGEVMNWYLGISPFGNMTIWRQHPFRSMSKADKWLLYDLHSILFRWN